MDQLGGRSYLLAVKDGWTEEFSAPDAAHALAMAQRMLPLGRHASLIEDGVTLAQLSYSPSGFWTVSPPG